MSKVGELVEHDAGEVVPLVDAVPADRLAISVGALELCRAAAADRPIIFLIDDYHWLDLASADVARFL